MRVFETRKYAVRHHHSRHSSARHEKWIERVAQQYNVSCIRIPDFEIGRERSIVSWAEEYHSLLGTVNSEVRVDALGADRHCLPDAHVMAVRAVLNKTTFFKIFQQKGREKQPYPDFEKLNLEAPFQIWNPAFQMRNVKKLEKLRGAFGKVSAGLLPKP